MDRWVNDFAEHGEISKKTMEKIGWLLADPSEDQLWELRWIIGWMRLIKSERLPEKSKEQFDQYSQTASAAESLAALVQADPHHSVSTLRYVTELAASYRARASDANPEGKRQRSNPAHYKLAYLLMNRISENKLLLTARVNNKSDLAKLFRLCCTEIEIKAPTNVVPYLTAAREQVAIEQRATQIRADMQTVMQRIVRSQLDSNTSPMSDDWQTVWKLEAELKALQKDEQ